MLDWCKERRRNADEMEPVAHISNNNGFARIEFNILQIENNSVTGVDNLVDLKKRRCKTRIFFCKEKKS